MKRNVRVCRNQAYRYSRSPLGDLMNAGLTSSEAEFLLMQIDNCPEGVPVQMTFLDNAHIARLHATLITNHIEMTVFNP